MNISVYDTSISDYNLGNQIIMDAVMTELYDLFPTDYIFKIPYMEITEHTLSIINSCRYSFFGGTNSLNGNLEKYSQMGINKHNYKKIHNFVSLGMGWWQYQVKYSGFSKKLLVALFNNGVKHSVRDEYTKGMLSNIGITNVINTGCPTLWRLKKNGYPQKMAENVIFTITDYNKNLLRDEFFLGIITKLYKHKYCFIQGAGDIDYIKSIDLLKNIEFISPCLKKYDEFLDTNDVDYIGTRLHAGIRALQHGKKALIIGIDNRALEMKRDFNLPVIPSEKISDIHEYLNTKIELSIPDMRIDEWKRQFYS